MLLLRSGALTLVWNFWKDIRERLGHIGCGIWRVGMKAVNGLAILGKLDVRSVNREAVLY
jgi:hypothetical protein